MDEQRGMTKGFVSLVGAGPGDPDLITVKGKARLEEADVVIYDYLANPALLGYCRADAERIYVGKQAGRHTLSQDEINALLVEHGRSRRVVRLKGGDPYIFGRGGEEAEVLQQAGIAWEVVPGITAGVAAPAYAGIPVTHRELASSVAFVTGHEDPTKPETAIDWTRLAMAIDTLVFYMGVGNLAEIAARLIENGRDPETPVAVIRWGTKPEQQTVTGTLATIADEIERARLRPPAITVVGDVVRLRDKLRWFDKRPLFGKRIIVTRAREQASALSQWLREAGAIPIEYPVIAFAPPEDWTPLDDSLRRLESFNWVIFTSINGVRSVVERMRELGIDSEHLMSRRIGAIGPATAAELERAGLTASFVPSEFVAEAVIAQIGDVRGQRILLPRADIAREALAEGLTAKGATVENVVAYRTVLGEAESNVVDLLRDGQIDAVTFTSSSTVRNFFARLEQSGMTHDEARRLVESITIAAIGPITASTAREHGLTVAIEAERYTIDGLVEALIETHGRKEA
jgi:uroporphyrinogen III methyltransferase / synthase